MGGFFLILCFLSCFIWPWEWVKLWGLQMHQSIDTFVRQRFILVNMTTDYGQLALTKNQCVSVGVVFLHPKPFCGGCFWTSSPWRHLWSPAAWPTTLRRCAFSLRASFSGEEHLQFGSLRGIQNEETWLLWQISVHPAAVLISHGTMVVIFAGRCCIKGEERKAHLSTVKNL